MNISTAVIHDAEKFKDYVALAADRMAQLGIEVVTRAKYLDTPQGDELPNHIVAVFRFPDRETVSEFYDDPTYEPLKVIRDEACEMTIRLYEE